MRITLLAFVGISLVACRGSGDDDATNTPPPDGTLPVGSDVKIQDIQSDAMEKFTPVALEGVVVLAVDTFGPGRTGDLWVGEPEGGPFSGVKVFEAPLDVLSVLRPGDIISISNAEKDEFSCTANICGGGTFDPGQSVTQIKGQGDGGELVIVKTGSGPLPEPAVVDSLAIEALPNKAAREAEWEKYEGVRVTVKNLRQLTALDGFGDGKADQQAFKATGGIEVQSSLTDLGPAVVDTCYASVTGIGDYFFTYKVLPTKTDDLVAGGTDCTVIAQPVDATVAETQNGTKTGKVKFTNVFVTGIEHAGRDGVSRGLWVSDNLQAAPLQGVLVFTGFAPDETVFKIGAKINVVGDVVEFDSAPSGQDPAGDTLTEISGATIELVTAPDANLPIAVASTAAVAGDLAAGEPFEGVLVSLANVKVSRVNAGAGKVELTDNDGAKIIMDNDSFDFGAVTQDQCFKSLTGVMSVQVRDNVRTINPRAATDFVAGAVGTDCD